MDPRPIQRVAPVQPQPTAAPPSRPTGDSGRFADELLEALRGHGGHVASNAVAPSADDRSTANQPDHADLAAADPFGFGSDGSISTTAIATRTEQLKGEFTTRLDALFATHGIDTNLPIELSADTFGRVRVAGDHPDAMKIEALFDESHELQQTFARISSAESLLRAAEQHQEFAAAYAEDPHGAATLFAHLFNAVAPQAEFRLSLADGDWTTRFE